MQNRFIIARHTENLRWTKKLSNGEILIYNSGGMEKAYLHKKESFLNIRNHRQQWLYEIPDATKRLEYHPDSIFVSDLNIGREAGKWLEYLINYYDDYAERNIFLQGYPFDHISLNYINDITNQEKDFGYIGRAKLNNRFNNRHWKMVNYQTGHGHDSLKIYKAIYGKEKPKRFKWKVGAQFFISKDLLLLNKKEYYLKLYYILKQHLADGPWCFERSWLTFLINSPQYAKVNV